MLLLWRVDVLQAQTAKVVSERKDRAAEARTRLGGASETRPRSSGTFTARGPSQFTPPQRTWRCALQNGTSCPQALRSCALIQLCAADSLSGTSSKSIHHMAYLTYCQMAQVC
jgi:hypothetical protein